MLSLRFEVKYLDVRVLFQLFFVKKLENVLEHEFGNISLGEVGAIEAVEAVCTENSSLVVRLVALSTLNEHSILFAHDFGLDNVH